MMDHVAIMKKSWGLLPKILSGKKTVESRWYLNRSAPWGKIQVGDRIYFKNSGEPVSVRAEAGKVLQYENLSPRKVAEILAEYGERDGISPEELPKYQKLFRDKRYCLLIFLKNSEKLNRPFEINKTGFGAMAAWFSTPKIDKIKMRFY